MKSLKRKSTAILRIAGLIILGAILIGAILIFNPAGQKNSKPTPTPIKGNTTYDEPRPTASSSTASPKASIASSATPLPKPTLQKSSGNAPGSSVPSGAMIEFTCTGIAGLNCDLKLTNSKNSGDVILLGKQKIVSNGRGQEFTLWDWPAKSGSWIVSAIMSDDAGHSSTSLSQTLEVR